MQINETIEDEINLNCAHLLVQVLRIITPQTGNSGNALSRYQKKPIEQKINCTKIYLCRNDEKLCYVMMNHELNKRIFHCDLLLRDNGKVACGPYLRLLAPYQVEGMMEGILMIKSTYPTIVMEVPS